VRILALASILFAAVAEASPTRLCVVGDSISARFFVLYSDLKPWSSILAISRAGTDFGIKNIAKSGDNTVLQRTTFDNELSGSGCSHVAFLIGTNDLTNFTSDSAATIYARIAAMATIVEAQGGRALLLTILPRGADSTWTGAMEQRRVALNALLMVRTPSLAVDTSTALADPAAVASTAWAASTVYALGTTRLSSGNVYQVITAGTSAGSGGPSGTSYFISDGSVTWQYLGTPWAASTAYSTGARVIADGKLYISSQAGTSAGSGGPTGTSSSISDGTATWTYMPRLRPSTNGALHPDTAGEALIAATVQAAVQAAGGW
jgi:hypothetical protein